ncbi:MAG: hypothetical protein ACYC5O_18460 [Anaerolineae bacterium]
MTVSDESEAEAEEDEVTHVIVVAGPGLGWAAVDRLSDGTVAAMLYTERELAEEIAHPESLVADVLAAGPLLYGDPELRIRILQKAGLAVPEALAQASAQ